MLRPLFVALIAAALLMPVVFRRQRRRAGLQAGALSPRFRRRLFATVGISTLLLVVGLTGVAVASDGDSGGTTTETSKTEITAVVATGKSQDATDTAQSAVIAKDHLAINYAWLMVGGVLA